MDVIAQAEVWTNEAGGNFSAEEQAALYQETQDTGAIDENGDEFVWVKKRKEKIMVAATTSSTHWVAVQDPSTMAMYYRHEETGETQWEEPEALESMKAEASAHANHHATELWEDLNKNREEWAFSLEEERKRQVEKNARKIMAAKQEMLNICQEEKFSIKSKSSSLLSKASMARMSSMHCMRDAKRDELAETCENIPSLELFMATHLQQVGAPNGPKADFSAASRITASLFHYYAAMGDPTQATLLRYALLRYYFKNHN